MSRPVALKGFKVKDGKVVRNQSHLSASERLRQKGSKKVRPARRGHLRP